jgi:hypothetical protein
MGGRILAGREFTAAEVQGNAKVAIVSEGLLRKLGWRPVRSAIRFSVNHGKLSA